MKKKIIITTISTFLVAMLLGIVITCYQNDNDVITLDDGTTIALVVDGASSSTLPTSGGYKADITCENADAVWKYNEDNSEWEIELSDITGSVTCYAEFTSLTDNDLAVNYITNLLGDESSVISGTGYLVDEGDAGYRYEGQNPKNYVWYNNELWRIIGVIPTVTENGTENLVKIIRDESIGAYAYDGKSSSYTGVWGSNTLYTLLNSYYWGALDATGTEYCVGYVDSTYGICDAHCQFTKIGINATGYYYSMVEYVYWNTGASGRDVTPLTAYINETATQIVGGYVGLMNASDYGYAYYSISHSVSMYSYTTSAILLSNWLYQTGNTWTLTSSTSSNNALVINYSGYVDNLGAYIGYAVRPVVYLSGDVYIVDGDGSATDPYILGTM